MKSTIELLNRYGGAWDSGGGGSGTASFSSITGDPRDNTTLAEYLYKTNLPKTAAYDNASNTVLAPTLGTPIYYRLEEITLDQKVSGYIFSVEAYTNPGDLEIAMYTGTGTGNVTQVANSSVVTNITSTGFKTATLSTPYILTSSQQSYYIGVLAISGTYSVMRSQSFRLASKICFTGATGVSALPAVETTRSSSDVIVVIKLI